MREISKDYEILTTVSKQKKSLFPNNNIWLVIFDNFNGDNLKRILRLRVVTFEQIYN